MSIRNNIISALCFALFASCNNPSGNNSGGMYVNFVVGTNHLYAWSFEMRDSLGNVLTSDSDNVVVIVRGTNESLDSLTGLILLETHGQRENPGSEFVWYRQNQDSLVEIAYSNPGRVPLVIPKQNQITNKKFTQNSSISPAIVPKSVQLLLTAKGIQLDSVRFRDDIRVVYKYPLTVGQQWTSFRDPFLQTRQMVGWENVTVKAGTFYCAKILTRIPELAPDLEWYDYVSAQGIVRRTIYFGNMLLTNENGDVIGTQSVNERSEMIQ